MKIISIDGRLGKDAEVISKDGRTYLRFSVANNVYENKQTRTEWIDVYSYDTNIINGLGKRLTKGQYVFVSGDFRAQLTTGTDGRTWLNQRIIANTIQFLYSGKKEDGTETTAQATVQTTAPASTVQSEVSVYTQAPVQVAAPVEQTSTPVQAPAPQPAYATVASSVSGPAADDDLPF